MKMTPLGKASVGVTISEDDMPRKPDPKRGGKMADMDEAIWTVHCVGKKVTKTTIFNMKHSQREFPIKIGGEVWVYDRDMEKK